MMHAGTERRLGRIGQKTCEGKKISRADAAFLASIPGPELFELFATANRVRSFFQGEQVDLCSIVNAKSGKCPEDCSYCAQSSGSRARIESYGLLPKQSVLARAKEARDGGARRFCIVTSGRRVSGRELDRIAEMVAGVRKLGLLPCATLGLLSEEDLRMLKEAGLNRYHNNLETSERFFPSLCSTHTYSEKKMTLRSARKVGLSICSGGIFGLGETWEDRIAMALDLRSIGPDSVPINFLAPIKGTALAERRPLDPLEALKIISIYRLILPDREIRVCGGRLQTLGELNAFIFQAGASGLLIGNYLTTLGRGYGEDLRLIEGLGLQRSPAGFQE